LDLRNVAQKALAEAGKKLNHLPASLASRTVIKPSGKLDGAMQLILLFLPRAVTMIFSTFASADRYAALHPLFPRAFEFIRNTDLLSLAPGRYPVIGDDLFAIVENVPGRTRAEAKLECHRKYIDIQLVLKGVDEMGWRPLADCSQPASDYSVEKDIQFFLDVPASWIVTPPDAFCIFFPEDAHAPLVSAGSIRKVILKVGVGEAG
jgi:YhcH/YjgK/YiaL family protein